MEQCPREVTPNSTTRPRHFPPNLTGLSNTNTTPYVWTPTAPNGTSGTKNYLTGGSTARSINDNGQVAGSVIASVTTGDGAVYSVDWPAVYLPSATGALAPGWNVIPLPGSSAGGGTWTSGGGLVLNNGLIVVGTADAYDLSSAPYPQTAATLWVWDPINGTRDLNALVAGSGWVLSSGTGINDSNQIVGVGTYNGVSKAFLLTLNP